MVLWCRHDREGSSKPPETLDTKKPLQMAPQGLERIMSLVFLLGREGLNAFAVVNLIHEQRHCLS